VLIGATERLVAATAGRCDALSADDLAVAAGPKVSSLAAAHVATHRSSSPARLPRAAAPGPEKGALAARMPTRAAAAALWRRP
jgi:hypothetical protein